MAASSALTPVIFHGATLLTILVNGVPMVALKAIVEAIGLDWAAQFTRLKRHPVLSTCIVVTTIQLPGDTQTREVVCLPLDKLNGWLFGVQASRCRPEIRARLIQYQGECFDVLAQHFGLAQPVAVATRPTLKNRRWLVRIDNNGREVVEAVNDDEMLGNWDQFTTDVEMGRCPPDKLLALSLAATTRLFFDTVGKPKGLGEDMARQITRDLPLSDLHTIATKATAELAMRCTGEQIRQKRLAAA